MIFNPVTGAAGSSLPQFHYTGQFQLIDDGKQDKVQNWRLRLLSSGVLTFDKLRTPVDVFLVGAGGGSAPQTGDEGKGYGGGGGGGYVSTQRSLPLAAGEAYEIVIGAGVTGARGGSTSAFSTVAEGGYPGRYGAGGDGGSGGGSGGAHSTDSYGSEGGVNGGDGPSKSSSGGKGSGATTREFMAATTDAFIVGQAALGEGWLSLSQDGPVLSPVQGTIYSVMTEGEYWYRDFVWNGSAYEETDLARLYAGGGFGAQQPAWNAKYTETLAHVTARSLPGKDGKTNTGAGGGGTQLGETNTGRAGGSGIVIIRNAR